MMIRSLIVAGLAVVGFALTTNSAHAAGPCNGPFCNQTAYPKYYSLGGHLFGKHQAPLPTYQAAPWYLYWPYDGHFLTPAPITGAFYGPPTPGNYPVNPYFPAPNYGYHPGYGGPIPRP